jgi:hypothetical protein
VWGSFAGVLFYLVVFLLEFPATAGNKAARALVNLASYASLAAAGFLAYVSLVIMRDVCLVCCSMYLIAMVMALQAWQSGAVKSKQAKAH